jgi:hypothetical protein
VKEALSSEFKSMITSTFSGGREMVLLNKPRILLFLIIICSTPTMRKPPWRLKSKGQRREGGTRAVMGNSLRPGF